MNINDPGPHHGPGCWCVVCSAEHRAAALQAPSADHGISPAQLREKVEALERRCDVLDAQLSQALVSISALNQGLLRVKELEQQLFDEQERYRSDRHQDMFKMLVQREKVEDVNQHLGSLAAMITGLTTKLDAALKRIDELERRPLAGGGLEFRDRHQGLEFR